MRGTAVFALWLRLGEEWKAKKGVKRAYPGARYASEEEWSSGDMDLAMFGLTGDGTAIAGGGQGPTMSSRRNAAGSPSKRMRVSNRAKHLVK